MLDRDNSGPNYRWSNLTPSQAQAVRDQYLSGTRVRQLASAYGVSVRTVQRAIQRATFPVEIVVVGKWWAEFSITPEGPVRMTPWYAVPESNERGFTNRAGSGMVHPAERNAADRQGEPSHV